MSLKEKETNIGEATRVGENMALVHMNISNEITVTGIQIHLTVMKEQTTGPLLDIVEIIQCHITTQSWVLTGNINRPSPLHGRFYISFSFL